jgi:NAD(P)-dependent dehydrogenase (short-subunit alcohol dehydrogenase family)
VHELGKGIEQELRVAALEHEASPDQRRFIAPVPGDIRALPVEKNAVRAIAEGLRLEAGPKLRVTNISPGFVQTNFADSMTNPEVKAGIENRMGEIAIAPDAISRAIAFAVEQPAEVDVSEIVIRPTAQA